ncbi:MAG: glycosyltransferase family 4 protein [Acidimicrobiia bacterium]|nr:glycosyltransferase family 4 protein [Acidimicrobiia bacterium]
MPRLAVVTNDFPPQRGGIQRYLGSLVDAYPGEVVVLAPRGGPAGSAATVIRHHRRFLWPTTGVTDWVVSQLAGVDVDVVLFGAPWPLPLMTDRIRRRLDRPVAVLSHGAEVTLPAAVPGAAGVLRRCLAAADLRFAVSRYTVGPVEALTGKPVHYLGAGVDLATFTPTIGTKPPVPVVGCVSRFVPRKGQHLLLDAVAELRLEGTALDVVLAGTGRMERSLRRQATRLGVPVRFVIDPPWDQLPRIYASLDVFAMPCRSRWFGLEVEGLGLVFLEAAASRLPVIAGASGGSPETVVDGETGYVVATHDQLVGALRTLTADGALRHRMGAAGRVRMEADFTWAAVVDRMLAAFAEVR